MGLFVLTVDYWLMAHVQTIDKFKLFFFNTGLSSVYTLDNFTEQCSTKKLEVFGSIQKFIVFEEGILVINAPWIQMVKRNSSD